MHNSRRCRREEAWRWPVNTSLIYTWTSWIRMIEECCLHMQTHVYTCTDIETCALTYTNKNLAKLSSWIYWNKTWNLSTLTLLWKFNYVVPALLDLGLECVNAQESDWDKSEGKRRWMKSKWMWLWCHGDPWQCSRFFRHFLISQFLLKLLRSVPPLQWRLALPSSSWLHGHTTFHFSCP